METTSFLLLILEICIFGIDGWIVGRLYWRFAREEKSGWPDGKTRYMIMWASSLAWILATSFVIGEIGRSTDFGLLDFLGPLTILICIAASLYRYRPR